MAKIDLTSLSQAQQIALGAAGLGLLLIIIAIIIW